MHLISFLNHKGDIQNWIATAYIKDAWDIYLRETGIVGIPVFTDFCNFLLMMLEVERIANEKERLN